MILDWVADKLQRPLVPPAGSAVRVKLLKLKENLEAQAKDEILGVIEGLNQKTGGISQAIHFLLCFK
uniref:Uncharacterized protein n=1 Tax=Rhizophora mucronata TaxID=61149 RepID=A0A2P2Q1B3_RHIMU